MDLLQTQLDKIQRQLAFVAVDPINWKGYVQASSWLVALFECYLLCVHWFAARDLSDFVLVLAGFDSTLCTLRNSQHLSHNTLTPMLFINPKSMAKRALNFTCSGFFTSKP
jgi:hypothetical protein